MASKKKLAYVTPPNRGKLHWKNQLICLI